MATFMRGPSTWSGRLRWRGMMVCFLLGCTRLNALTSRERGKIIRENVNGTKEVIVDEGHVYYVLCKCSKLTVA